MCYFPPDIYMKYLYTYIYNMFILYKMCIYFTCNLSAVGFLKSPVTEASSSSSCDRSFYTEVVETSRSEA